MRIYTVNRNDKEPTTVRAEKVLLANDEYIFSRYDVESGYDVVVSIIKKDAVVEIMSEEVQTDVRLYKAKLKDGSVQEIAAECTKVVEGEVIFMNYDDTYSNFTTVTTIPTEDLEALDVVN